MRLVKKIALSAATLGLVVSPVASVANTRAGDGTASYTTAASQPGTGRDASGENLFGGEEPIFLYAILSALAVAGVIIIIDGGDEQGPDGPAPPDPPPNQSPGAN